MSNSPRISVLLTSYNRERYIAAAIESVLAQSFIDFELLIVDDGSKDATIQIAGAICAIHAFASWRTTATWGSSRIATTPRRWHAANF
jgi:Glycosyltransferases involved in cell wall biogenesis